MTKLNVNYIPKRYYDFLFIAIFRIIRIYNKSTHLFRRVVYSATSTSSILRPPSAHHHPPPPSIRRLGGYLLPLRSTNATKRKPVLTTTHPLIIAHWRQFSSKQFANINRKFQIKPKSITSTTLLHSKARNLARRAVFFFSRRTQERHLLRSST